MPKEPAQSEDRQGLPSRSGEAADSDTATQIIRSDNVADFAAANDNAPSPRPANDNDIVIIDHFQKPLPIIPGEAKALRSLLGARFRQILFGE
jgi:hypothetical protein